MQITCGLTDYTLLLRKRPNAIANIRGSRNYTSLCGTVRFYETKQGLLIAAEIRCLPETETGFFGFHIHEGCSCTGNETDPFANALTHYNPNSTPHPRHAGDLPPLLGNDGYAVSVFMTDRFTIREILGRTIIIHSHPDDFTSQPAGNAGTKIACGVICPA